MMKTKMLIALFTITLAVLLASQASAFASITSIEVDGVEGRTGNNIAVFAGQKIPVKIIFTTSANANDVRVKTWLAGSREYAVATPRFDVLSGNTYTKLLYIDMPYDLNNKEENYDLQVAIENKDAGLADEETVNLLLERESYMVDVLDIFMPSKLTSGSLLPIDVVIKNRGRQFAEDTFVKISIPALGIEDRAYLGDLSPIDQANPDKEDAIGRRLSLKIPSTTPTGTYIVEIETYNADAAATLTRKLIISGASEETQAIAGVQTKTFSTGKNGGEYAVTLINEGNNIKVYEIIPEVSAGLNVNVEEPIIVVPAGLSKTIKVVAEATKAGDYEFALNIHSNNELVKRVPLTANVIGANIGGNATVLLTVILAIIFIVLLVVLIVLLTKKPEHEGTGESYY